MLMAQTCSDDSPARRSPALSSCKSRLTLNAGRGRLGWVGGPARRLPRITQVLRSKVFGLLASAELGGQVEPRHLTQGSPNSSGVEASTHT
jgi:hypothetical protein